MKNEFIARNLADIAKLSARLTEIDSDENRTRVLAQYDGDLSGLYAQLYGSAKMIGELMAQAAEQAASHLSRKAAE